MTVVQSASSVIIGPNRYVTSLFCSVTALLHIQLRCLTARQYQATASDDMSHSQTVSRYSEWWHVSQPDSIKLQWVMTCLTARQYHATVSDDMSHSQTVSSYSEWWHVSQPDSITLQWVMTCCLVYLTCNERTHCCWRIAISGMETAKWAPWVH